MRLLLFFALFCVTTFGQQIDFEGYVLDANTKEPIPYVNLSFLNTLVGTSTDENGHFLLEIPKAVLEKQVHISALAYKDTILGAKQMNYAKKVFLVEETFELKEVEVVENLGDVQVLNPISSYEITSGFDSSSTPWVVALYFPNIGARSKYVEKVTIFFRENAKFKRERSKFRLRLYDVHPETMKPNKDLLKKSLVLEAVQGKAYTTIDVSGFNIKVPRHGIYVGLEWLFVPYNWYRQNEKDQITNTPKIEDRFAPTFGGVYTTNSNYKVMIYGMGQWQHFMVKSKNNKKNLVPAVSLRVAQELD